MSEHIPPIESERRIATVMFADIAGFTAMSERMDPEDVADVMKDCFSLMGACIEEYGGTIDKFIGDCVMVLFGAPQAQEDAPQRALNTALKIKTRLKDFNTERHLATPLDIHIGINTGPVIAGLMGSDKRQDFTVMGDTVNLASRLEGAAEKGTILISESTYRLAEGYFDFAYAGEVRVKGKELPVKTWSVLGPRRIITRIEAGPAKGLSPFVGRGDELQHLHRCLAQAREGRGQVVGIMGEPGVGKSRLLLQFRESLDPAEVICIEGGCINFGDAIPYLPILDVLKDFFAIHEDDNEHAIKEKIAAAVTRFGSNLTHILSPLHEVLSLKVDDEVYAKLDGKQRRDRVFDAIRLLLVAQSHIKPLVVIIEDLHWIDKTSEEFLSYLINGVASTRILLVLLFRPGYNPAWVTKTYYSQVRVDQLSRTTSRDLVQGIIAGTVDTELADFIVARTEGNPLFIEELISSLRESRFIRKDIDLYRLALNPGNIEVPATIQGIIAARLDRLEATLKGIMQTASVIGREFAFRILQAVASLKEDLQSALLSLQDLELIYEKNIFPELEYIFKHALTRDVAYNSLLIKKRKETHTLVAQAIEQLYADRLEEFYETLAFHYSQSDNAGKACAYLKLSGEKSARNYANTEALRFYKEALRILEAHPESLEIKQEKVAVSLKIGDLSIYLSYPEDTLKILHDASTIADELGDEDSRLEIYYYLSQVYSATGNPPLGLEYAEKCFHVAEQGTNYRVMAQNAVQLVVAYYLSGNCAKAAEIGDRAIHRLEEQHLERESFGTGTNLYSQICTFSGVSLGLVGKYREGSEVLEKGYRNACELDAKFSMGFMQMLNCVLTYFAGYGDETIDHAHKAMKLFEEAGIQLTNDAPWYFIGGGHFFRGEYEKALAAGEKGHALARELGVPFSTAWSNLILAITLMSGGEIERARGYAEAGLNISRESHAETAEGTGHILVACMTEDLTPAGIDQTQARIMQGIALLHKPATLLSALGYLFLGEFLAKAGRTDDAAASLKKAESIYLESGITPASYWLTRARDGLARLRAISTP